MTRPLIGQATESHLTLFPVDEITHYAFKEGRTTIHGEGMCLTRDSATADSFRDPAFMENKVAPVHRWVPWIAGFSGQFVADVFREFLPSSRTSAHWSLIHLRESEPR